VPTYTNIHCPTFGLAFFVRELQIKSVLLKIHPGANPTIVNYSGSVVKFYNAASSLVRFGNKNIFFILKLHFEKCVLEAKIFSSL
jgi:hypothetical protein